MLSPHFSEMRPAFLKLFFQWGSFDIGLIRVGASPEFTTVTSTMSRLNFRTHIKHCDLVEIGLTDLPKSMAHLAHPGTTGLMYVQSTL